MGQTVVKWLTAVLSALLSRWNNWLNAISKFEWPPDRSSLPGMNEIFGFQLPKKYLHSNHSTKPVDWWQKLQLITMKEMSFSKLLACSLGSTLQKNLSLQAYKGLQNRNRRGVGWFYGHLRGPTISFHLFYPNLDFRLD